MKVLHLIAGLGAGGAEMMLYKLLSHMDATAFRNEVISLTDCGPISQNLQSLGVPVCALGMSRGMPSPQALFALKRRIRQAQPDVIQTWMYHADLLGGIASRLAGVPVVWNIRNASLERYAVKHSTLWTAKMCALLSRRLPACIVCCSEAASRGHIAYGYAAEKIRVISNGFALESYLPDAAARAQVRLELDIPDDAPLIGLVARFDPAKDHANFIRAAGAIRKSHPQVHYLLCGKGVIQENTDLMEKIADADIGKNCRLLGLRHDVPRLTAALDIAVSSSSSEAFPNAVGEAMACGIPCAVTDVGDSAMLVGDTGRIVPRRDAPALANAWREMLDMGEEDRRRLGALARQRVETHFDIKEIALSYQRLYQEIMTPCAA
ncbi:MAG: glycosyltransferase [Armatimonadota bacterium]|nr:glycosyltransferase [Armatimonadota bacterium]